MLSLTLEEFAQATVNVVGHTPVEEYLPTFVVDDEILVLEGIPADVDQRDAIQDHAGSNGWNSGEFMFGVRSGDRELTIGRYTPSGCEFALLTWRGESVQLRAVEQPDWWWLNGGRTSA